MDKVRFVERLCGSRIPVFIFYAALALAIMYPLLGRGYVFAMDISSLVYGPARPETALYGLSGLNYRLPYYLTGHFMNYFLPQWITEKVFIFLALFLAGWGAHRLIPGTSRTGKYFGGMLYVLNPFVYVRLLAGQLGIVLGYAFMPFAFYYFLRVLEHGGTKNLVLTMIFLTLVSIFSYHMMILVLLAFLVLFLVKAAGKWKDKKALAGLAGRVAIIALGFLLLNAYSLLPNLMIGSEAIGQVTTADADIFAPQSHLGAPVAFEVASMHGFWRDGYIYIADILPFWSGLFIFILFLVFYGLFSLIPDRRNRWMAVAFGVLGTASFILGVGIAASFSRPVFDFFWDNLPFFQSLRDSQKFVGLICLCYAFLGGVAINDLIRSRANIKAKTLRTGVLILVIAGLVAVPFYGSVSFGLHGQVGTTDYPESWYEVNTYLNEDSDDFNVLFLPWHAWMWYDWIPNRDKSLASPAPHIFDKPIIKADNLEILPVQSESTNPISAYVEFLLSHDSEIDNFGELLAPLNVKYVILVKEADYRQYDFLYSQSDMSMAMEKEDIILFQNDHPTSRAYGVDNVIKIDSLDEFLELSRQQDVMEHIYLFEDDSSPEGGIRSMEPIPLEEISPVKYKVGGASGIYTVFTVPQGVNSAGWEYNGQQPLKNLGFMPVFLTSAEGGTIVYTTFYHTYLPAYIVSLLSVIALIAYWLFKRRKSKRAETETEQNLD